MPPCAIIGSVIIDPQTVSVSIAYQLLTTAVVPRPIGFISSLSPKASAKGLLLERPQRSKLSGRSELQSHHRDVSCWRGEFD
jgi:hypothetical protein